MKLALMILAGYLVVSAISFVVMFILAWRAPLGYEDETGFHLGEPPTPE